VLPPVFPEWNALAQSDLGLSYKARLNASVAACFISQHEVFPVAINSVCSYPETPRLREKLKVKEGVEYLFHSCSGLYLRHHSEAKANNLSWFDLRERPFCMCPPHGP